MCWKCTGKSDSKFPVPELYYMISGKFQFFPANSTRSVPDDAPRFSLKSEFRFHEVETEQDQEMDLNDSRSSLSESSPVDIDNSYQGHE